jgi:hypothetical protein
MVPWPTPYVETPFVQPPMNSPTQESLELENQDRFAVCHAGQCMPPSNHQVSNLQQPLMMHVQQPHQQPIQQNGYMDPWAVRTAPPAPAPMAPPHQHSSPPPSVVVYDGSNQAPTSPIGDVSVMVAPAFSNNSILPTLTPTNPFDFCYVSSSMPTPAQSPSIMPSSSNMIMPPPPNVPPPPAPPSPPRANTYPAAANHQQLFAPQLQVQQTSPFGYATSPTSNQMSSPPLSPVQAFSTVLPQSSGYGVSPTQQQSNSPPTSPAAAFSPTPHPGIADPFGYASSPMTQQIAVPPTALVPHYSFAPQQAYEDPFGYAFSPVTSPFTSPNGSPGAGAGAMVPSAGFNADPFGVAANVGLPPYMPGTQDPTTTHAMVPSVAAVDGDPFDVFSNQPVSATADSNPSGSYALVTSGVVDSDPFGLFGTPTPVPTAPSQLPITHQLSAPTTPVEGDLLGGVGFESAPSQPNATSFNTSNSKPEEQPITLDSNNLPSEGEYYEARITARTLGAMFYSPRNLQNTLLYKMPNNILESLGSRPMVVCLPLGKRFFALCSNRRVNCTNHIFPF